MGGEVLGFLGVLEVDRGSRVEGLIPRRVSGNGNREKGELHQVLLSLALCALCGGPGFRSIAESEADKEGQERKIRFRVRPKPWGSAARPGSMGWAPRGTLGERKQGGRRSGDGLLSHPSVLSVPSVVKIKWEGGRIGGREAAGTHGIFSDYHREHRGHRGGEGGRGFGVAGRSRARSRERGSRGGYHGGDWGTETGRKANCTRSSPLLLSVPFVVKQKWGR